MQQEYKVKIVDSLGKDLEQYLNNESLRDLGWELYSVFSINHDQVIVIMQRDKQWK
jgi:hypothetical protein